MRKPLGVGRFAGLVAIDKKKSDKDEACGGVGEGEGGADPSTGEGLGSRWGDGDPVNESSERKESTAEGDAGGGEETMIDDKSHHSCEEDAG